MRWTVVLLFVSFAFAQEADRIMEEEMQK